MRMKDGTEISRFDGCSYGRVTGEFRILHIYCVYKKLNVEMRCTLQNETNDETWKWTMTIESENKTSKWKMELKDPDPGYVGSSTSLFTAPLSHIRLLIIILLLTLQNERVPFCSYSFCLVWQRGGNGGRMQLIILLSVPRCSVSILTCFQTKIYMLL